MDYEKDAKYLDGFISAEETERKKCAEDISEALVRLDTELSLIKKVIRKYNLYFYNSVTDGISKYGIVIGGTRDEPLCFIKGGVFALSDDGEEIVRKTVLSNYVMHGDLSVIKAGFDFVINFSAEGNPISKRLQEMRNFLDSIQHI